MEWDFTGNIARIGTKYETLEILEGSASVLTYLREALSSTSGLPDKIKAYGRSVIAEEGTMCFAKPRQYRPRVTGEIGQVVGFAPPKSQTRVLTGANGIAGIARVIHSDGRIGIGE
jgi:hypothetical protein